MKGRPGVAKSVTWPAFSYILICLAGRRGCAGDSARSATHGCANRGAGRASDRKRHETPDRCTDAGTLRAARHGASAGVRVPTSIPLVIPTVIGRVGEPVNMLILLVGGVPIGVVVGDRRIGSMSI